jgi:hypothetical protein
MSRPLHKAHLSQLRNASVRPLLPSFSGSLHISVIGQLHFIVKEFFYGNQAWWFSAFFLDQIPINIAAFCTLPLPLTLYID